MGWDKGLIAEEEWGLGGGGEEGVVEGEWGRGWRGVGGGRARCQSCYDSICLV